MALILFLLHALFLWHSVRTMEKDWKKYLPVLILLLAAALRFRALAENPPGFFRDEADKGYAAYCLLETGADITGRPWPIFISSLSVYTTALYQYILIPFIQTLGLNELAVRMPAALFGTMTVGMVFLLARRWMGFYPALASAFLLAVSPWHVHFSRWANQGILLPFFLTTALYCRERSPQKKIWLGLAGASFALALYAYEPAKVVVPALLFCLAALSWTYSNRVQLKRDGCLIVVVLLASIPMILFHLNNPEMSNARYRNISIFAASENNLLTVSVLFMKNYFAHFSPKFLFFTGDAELRHAAKSVGELYLFQAILLGLAIFGLFRTKRSADLLLVLWILISFVPAALTNQGIPHALRSISGVTAFALLSGRGGEELFYLGGNAKTRSAAGILGIVILLSAVALIGFFITDYFTSYPIYSAAEWEYGWKEVYQQVQREKDACPNLVISGKTSYPEIFFLFYTKYSPVTVQSSGLPGICFFLPFNANAEDYLSQIRKPAVFVGLSGELPDLPTLAVVNYPDGSPAWRLAAIR